MNDTGWRPGTAGPERATRPLRTRHPGKANPTAGCCLRLSLPWRSERLRATGSYLSSWFCQSTCNVPGGLSRSWPGAIASGGRLPTDVRLLARPVAPLNSAIGGGPEHVRIARCHLAGSDTFGFVHGSVGADQQAVRPPAVPKGNTDAGRDMHRGPVELEGSGQHMQHPLGASGCLSAVSNPFEENHELVTAEPGEGVGVAKATPQSVGAAHQQLVTCVVAMAVVDELEPIQVDEQYGDGGVDPCGQR